MAPYGAIAIPLCVALLAVTLRRVHGLRYWMAVMCVIGLSLGAMQWLPEAQEYSRRNHSLIAPWIFFYAVPMSCAFATANARALRARPWLVIILVPLVYLTTMFVGVVVGVNLDVLSP